MIHFFHRDLGTNYAIDHEIRASNVSRLLYLPEVRNLRAVVSVLFSTDHRTGYTDPLMMSYFTHCVGCIFLPRYQRISYHYIIKLAWWLAGLTHSRLVTSCILGTQFGSGCPEEKLWTTWRDWRQKNKVLMKSLRGYNLNRIKLV